MHTVEIQDRVPRPVLLQPDSQRQPHFKVPFTSREVPLLSEAERSCILDHTHSLYAALPEVWCKLWDHLYQETARNISECSRQHLARIALGMQHIGVVAHFNGSGFDVRFVEEADGNVRDAGWPWPADVELLPRLPSLLGGVASKSALEFIEEISTIAGYNAAQRRRLWIDVRTVGSMLDFLTTNDTVVDEIRRRLLEAYESRYIVDLEAGTDMIYEVMRERLDALAQAESAISHARRMRD